MRLAPACLIGDLDEPRRPRRALADAEDAAEAALLQGLFVQHLDREPRRLGSSRRLVREHGRWQV
jgi:hypothetical protein